MPVPIRVVHNVQLHISQDVDDQQKNSMAERHVDLSKVTIDTYAKQNSGNFDIPDTQMISLSLGNITSLAKGLYIETTEDCAVRLNGSSDPINLKKGTNQSLAKLFIEADISAVTITADQAAAVDGYFALWGEEAPTT